MVNAKLNLHFALGQALSSPELDTNSLPEFRFGLFVTVLEDHLSGKQFNKHQFRLFWGPIHSFGSEPMLDASKDL